MENKNLIKEELSRIFEIMGISGKNSQLLTESVIDDVISFMVKKGGGTTVSDASMVAKFETDFGVPSGTLRNSDIASLKAGGSAADAVVGKIVRSLPGSKIDEIAESFYENTQAFKDDTLLVTNEVMNNFRNGTTFPNKAALETYATDQARIMCSSRNPDISSLVIATQKKIKNKIVSEVEGIPGFKYGDDATPINVVDDVATKDAAMVSKVKLELKRVANEIRNKKLKVDPSFPKDVTDADFDVVYTEIKNALESGDEIKLERVRQNLIATFGSDPTVMASRIKNVESNLGTSLDTVGTTVEKTAEIITKGGKSFTKFGLKNAAILAGIATLGYAVYEGVNLWNSYKSDNVNKCSEPGSQCYCWSKNLTNFNSLSKEDKAAIFNTGIGCTDFGGTNPPIAVNKVKNVTTGVDELIIRFKDDTEKKLDPTGKEVKAGSGSGGGSGSGSGTGTGTKYPYNKSGVLAWAKDNNLSQNVDDYDFTNSEGGFYKSGSDWQQLFYVGADGKATIGTPGTTSGTWSKTVKT